jgi:zinc-ribbon domain
LRLSFVPLVAINGNRISDPEIARRCTACGVSVRQHAMFCPQCGNPIAKVDTAPTEALRTDLAATQPLSAVVQPPPPTQNVPTSDGMRAHDGMRGRVDKFRKVSSIMIDQAAYDPSLRFLLVAAGLFLLFLVLLILSKVLG